MPTSPYEAALEAGLGGFKAKVRSAEVDGIVEVGKKKRRVKFSVFGDLSRPHFR